MYIKGMYIRRTGSRTLLLAVALTAALYLSAAAADPAASLLKKVKAASTTLKDIKAVMVVTSINKDNAEEINPAFSDIGLFQKATVYYKHPGKYRAEGVARGMAVAYVENAKKSQIVIPGVMKKTSDVSGKPGKQRTTLDMGFITDLLWQDNKVTHLGTEGKLLKLKLTPKRDDGHRYELIWVDPSNMRLVRRQRYNGAGEFRAKYVYSNYMNVGKIPVAKMAKIYAKDGGHVGTVEYKDIKVNSKLPDSLFTLVK